MKYQSKIVGLGPDALAFLEDEDMNFIIIFNEDAPPELAELSRSVFSGAQPLFTNPCHLCVAHIYVESPGSNRDEWCFCGYMILNHST